MNVKIHRSIVDIDEGAWDAIVGKDRIFCTHKYVEALEKSGLNTNGCYYPVVYNGDEIIAHGCVYSISTELDLFARGILKKMVLAVRRKWKNFFILRSLECGPPIALGNTISLKDGADRALALQTLCRAIEDLAKGLDVKFILFRDFYDEDMAFFDSLKARGYVKLHNLPKAEIKLKWKSFDEYLNSMRSNYRCKIVKSVDKCAKAGISIQTMKNPSESSRELKRLLDNVSNQAKEIKREPLSESFFQNLDKYFGEKIVALAAKKDNKLIGYMLVFFNDKEAIPGIVGLDYTCNRGYYTYFNLFYRTIELAINAGMDKVDMGITALNPKRDMGSEILALNMYMKHSNPLLNKIIPVLFDMITPPDTTELRNVFKEADTCQAPAAV